MTLQEIAVHYITKVSDIVRVNGDSRMAILATEDDALEFMVGVGAGINEDITLHATINALGDTKYEFYAFFIDNELTLKSKLNEMYEFIKRVQ